MVFTATLLAVNIQWKQYQRLMKVQELTQARLKELLDYNQDTGVFTWKVNRGPMKDGDIAGSVSKFTGYIKIMISGTNYFAHRMAILYVSGFWPKDESDHINGNRADNRINNLRLVSRSVNSRNLAKRIDNTSGCTGVHLDSISSKWRAEIVFNHKRIYLGLFTDKNDAIKARKDANIKYGFHPNHGREKIISYDKNL